MLKLNNESINKNILERKRRAVTSNNQYKSEIYLFTKNQLILFMFYINLNLLQISKNNNLLIIIHLYTISNKFNRPTPRTYRPPTGRSL
jgi:hypothetical protein